MMNFIYMKKGRLASIYVLITITSLALCLGLYVRYSVKMHFKTKEFLFVLRCNSRYGPKKNFYYKHWISTRPLSVWIGNIFSLSSKDLVPRIWDYIINAVVTLTLAYK